MTSRMTRNLTARKIEIDSEVGIETDSEFDIELDSEVDRA